MSKLLTINQIETLTSNHFKGGCSEYGYGNKDSLITNQCPFCGNRIVTNQTEEEMRKGFEQHISENPHDTSAHHIYADYLDEVGHPEEAHERRRLGLALEGRTDPRLGLTPHLAWRRAIKASSKANQESWKVPKVNVPLTGIQGAYLSSRIASHRMNQIAKGIPNETYGDREPPNHLEVANTHNDIMKAHQLAGQTEAAKAHRLAALAHQVAHHVEWSKEAQAAATNARRASERAYVHTEHGLDEDDPDDNDTEFYAYIARDAANRAAYPQGTLAAHRNAIASHQEVIGRVRDTEPHQQAIAAHQLALRLKSRRK